MQNVKFINEVPYNHIKWNLLITMELRLNDK